MRAAEHDGFVALVSHVPQLVAAAMAAQCGGAPAGGTGPGRARPARVTRIAAGDAGLWTEILGANAAAVREIRLAVGTELADGAPEALGAESAGDEDAASGRPRRSGPAAGCNDIPGKHGGPAPAYAVVQVVVGDRPGELARLFAAAGACGVNLEDLRLEHSPGLPAGVAELSVRPEATEPLAAALTAGGWPVASPA